MSSDSLSGGAHLGEEHAGAEHLIKMVNDIGNFFRSEPVREDAGLDDLPREAVRRLNAPLSGTPQASAPRSAA